MKSAHREECPYHNFQAGGEGMRRLCLGKREFVVEREYVGPCEGVDEEEKIS